MSSTKRTPSSSHRNKTCHGVAFNNDNTRTCMNISVNSTDLYNDNTRTCMNISVNSTDLYNDNI